MEHGARILLDLFVMFAAAKALGEICERLRVPGVIGEMLAGVVIGPYALGWIHPGEVHSLIAQIGVVFLLFLIGLETKPNDMFRVGKLAALVGAGGIVLPFLGGYALMHATGHPIVESFFVGAAMVATSVGITARVLSDIGALAARASRVILGAAVIDDVLGMLVLAVVASLAAGQLEWLRLAILFVEAIAFVVIVAWIGSRVVARLHGPVFKMKSRRPGFAFALVLCLGLSVAAGLVGMAAIIGAFLAGLALAEKKDEWDLEERVEGVTGFLTPFFFVTLGMQMDLSAFAKGNVIGLALLATLVAIVGKLVGCGLTAWSLGGRDALRVGVGMVPRGEVGLIVALMGMQTGAVTPPVYGIVLFMVVVTTVLPPFFLVPLFKNVRHEPEPEPESLPELG